MSMMNPLEHEPPKFDVGAVLQMETGRGDPYIVIVLEIIPPTENNGTMLYVHCLGQEYPNYVSVEWVVRPLADAQWLANNLDPNLFDLRDPE